MLPTQPSVTVCRRGKHATKRGTSFAAHLPCFIGLLNVLCRIVAYVRTGHVTEIISRVSQQFGLGAQKYIRARVVLLIDGLGHFTDSRSPTTSLRVSR